MVKAIFQPHSWIMHSYTFSRLFNIGMANIWLTSLEEHRFRVVGRGPKGNSAVREVTLYHLDGLIGLSSILVGQESLRQSEASLKFSRGMWRRAGFYH